jgi:LL-diaminopimelate aminotransferase
MNAQQTRQSLPAGPSRFAARLDRLPAFLFAELKRKIAEKERSGVDVISLGSGDPDIPTPAGIVEEAQRALAEPQSHRYPTNRGLDAFREAAAGYMQYRFGVRLDPGSEIFPTLGGKEAIHHLGLACLNPGDVALAPDPAYPVYASATALADAEVHRLPLTAANGFLPDLGGIDRDVLRRARLLFLNYPNNPTGATLPEGFFADIVAFARDYELIVIHDNAYADLAFDGYRPPAFLATPGAKSVGVEVFSLSKGWNMTGWRVGWVAGNAEIVRRLAHLKPNIDSGLFLPIQRAAIAALTHHREFPRHMSEIYRARGELMVAALRSAGIEAERPRATPFLWFPVPTSQSSAELADSILDQTGVVVSPGSAFGPSGEGYLRISLTVGDDRLREAARRIESSLQVGR